MLRETGESGICGPGQNSCSGELEDGGGYWEYRKVGRGLELWEPQGGGARKEMKILGV